MNESHQIKDLKSLVVYLQRYVDRRLWLKVLIAMASGVGIGILMSPDLGLVNEDVSVSIGNWLALPGKLFLKLVQMIMIPLIFASIIIGITSNDKEQLKRMGLGVGIYFIFTTVVSIVIGTVLAILLKPGEMLQQSGVETELATSGGEGSVFSAKNIPQMITDLLPDNPLASMVSGEMLGIVLFTIIIGIAVMNLKAETRLPINKLLVAIQEISMTVVKWAIRLVPIAVFGLMAQLTSNVGLISLTGIGYYALVVLLGLFILLMVYMLIVSILGRRRPLQFIREIGEVQLLAFSTTSSAAVMPLSMKTAEEKLHVSPAVSNFVIPIGATVNMDGTAVYQAITTLFIAQMYGIDLPLMNIVLVMFTIVAASIGTPGIPGGGMIILSSVLQSAGIPTEGIIIIIGVERILGMFRTAINVTGDLTACVVFNRWIK